MIRALEQFVSAVEGHRLRPAAAGDIYFELGPRRGARGQRRSRRCSPPTASARAWHGATQRPRPASAGLGADALAPLAESVFAFIDELSARSAEGYAYEQSLAAGEAAGRRRALVQLMVARPPAEPAAVEDAAREAGWPLPETLAALVWRGDPELRLASRLPLGSLAARVRDDMACALVPGRLRARAGWRSSTRSFDGETAPRSGPLVPWPETWRSAARAGAALRLAADGLLPDDGLARHRPPPGRARRSSATAGCSRIWPRRACAPLDGRTAGARTRLLETLRALARPPGTGARRGARPPRAPADRPLPACPAARRVRDDLDDPDARFELALALREGQATSRSRPDSTS